MSTPPERAPEPDVRDAATAEPLRPLVRAALAADEVSTPPAFADVYAAARRRNAAAATASGRGRTRAASSRRTYVLAGAVASVAALALAVVIARPWEAPAGTPPLAQEHAADAPIDTSAADGDPDYAAALALRRSMRTGTPLDAALASLPDTVARGMPALPAYRYPLLPEDALTGAASSSRNPS